LAEAGIHPDWVAGISIGAINAAIIAGNPPETRVVALFLCSDDAAQITGANLSMDGGWTGRLV
jgi:predicted acylesterase/phospholipase RssA